MDSLGEDDDEKRVSNKELAFVILSNATTAGSIITIEQY
jgi:hypothetical protein